MRKRGPLEYYLLDPESGPHQISPITAVKTTSARIVISERSDTE